MAEQLGLSGTVPKEQAEQGAQCPANDAYDQIISKVARQIYDPKWLGDIEQLKNKHNCDIKNNRDAIAYADQALKLPNDQYTDVIPPNEVEQRERREQGSFKGVGVTFPPSDSSEELAPKGPHKLVDVTKGGPAERAGVKPGDVLTAVNGQSLSDKTVDDTVNMILNAASDDVRLSVLRDGKELNFDMKREVINVPAVQTKMLDGNVAHISIKSFGQKDMAQELKEAIEQTKDASSYIIDLRDNPGGFVDQALLASSLFVSEGRLLSERERADSPPEEPEYDVITYDLTKDKIDATRTYEAMPGLEKSGTPDLDRFPDMVDKPVVVLVNGNSASASEIFTAALKDNRVATVIGEKTFGKGIGQMTWHGMPEGSWLQTTTFRYYTPNGKWLGDAHNERYGITPDIVVPMNQGATKGTADDNQLQAAVEFLSMRRK